MDRSTTIKQKKADAELDVLDKAIPLHDCILTEMNVDGEVTGFKTRPELLKAILWQEDGEDWTHIYRVIKTVNYMNRLMFEPDDYLISTKAKPAIDTVIEKIVDEPEPVVEEVKEPETEKVSSSSSSEEGEPLDPNPGQTALIELLKHHSAAMTAKGHGMKERYQERMNKDMGWEELMKYAIPNVFETLKTTERVELG